MNPTEKEDIRRWLQVRERAAIALEEIRRNELRNYDYQKNLPILDGMLQWACDHSEPRLTSGLVEQQRLFTKIRKLNESKSGKEDLL
jgi:hypothetical protein